MGLTSSSASGVVAVATVAGGKALAGFSGVTDLAEFHVLIAGASSSAEVGLTGGLHQHLGAFDISRGDSLGLSGWTSRMGLSSQLDLPGSHSVYWNVTSSDQSQGFGNSSRELTHSASAQQEGDAWVWSYSLSGPQETDLLAGLAPGDYRITFTRLVSWYAQYDEWRSLGVNPYTGEDLGGYWDPFNWRLEGGTYSPFAVTFSVVPAPGAAVLLGCAGRRTRRRGA